AATVSLTIAPVNDAPLASDRSFGIRENDSLTLVPAVLGADAAGDPMTAAVVDGPAHGTVQNFDGTLFYQPANGFVGTDSFTFLLNDGQLDGNVSTVTIVVAPNQPPIGVDDQATVAEDTVLHIDPAF